MKQTLKVDRIRDLELVEEDQDGVYNSELWRVDWKQFGFKYCGVYLVAPESGTPVKIGISETAVKRLAQLQTSHWQRLVIWDYWICENRHAAQKVEKKAHTLLQDLNKHLLGEWFDMRGEAVSRVVEFAAMHEAVELVQEIPNNDKFREVVEYLDRAVRDLVNADSGLRIEKNCQSPFLDFP